MTPVENHCSRMIQSDLYKILTLIFATDRKDLLHNFSSFLLIKFQSYFKMIITKRLTIKFNKNSKYNEIIFVTYINCKKGSASNVPLSINCILLQDKSLEKVKGKYCLNYLLDI